MSDNDRWKRFVDSVDFKSIEERMFQYLMGDRDDPYPEQPIGFTSPVVPFPDNEVIDMNKGTDGVFRRKRIREDDIPIFFGADFASGSDTPIVYVFDECADVNFVDIESTLHERRSGETITGRFTKDEPLFAGRDEVAHRESVRRAVDRIPVWSNRHDLLRPTTIRKPVVVGNYCGGLSDPKKWT
jgi:hypothetical protein